MQVGAEFRHGMPYRIFFQSIKNLIGPKLIRSEPSKSFFSNHEGFCLENQAQFIQGNFLFHNAFPYSPQNNVLNFQNQSIYRNFSNLQKYMEVSIFIKQAAREEYPFFIKPSLIKKPELFDQSQNDLFWFPNLLFYFYNAVFSFLFWSSPTGQSPEISFERNGQFNFRLRRGSFYSPRKRWGSPLWVSPGARRNIIYIQSEALCFSLNFNGLFGIFPPGFHGHKGSILLLSGSPPPIAMGADLLRAPPKQKRIASQFEDSRPLKLREKLVEP
uniref:hypothetical protein n=1 Tax=Cephaleuros parasiticus TaxID=173370 RepID=UPI001EE010CE|nr:hypothetical protein MFQ79_pgp032 [Cephaleuros parasiticus]UIB39030.1 hypothetical protein [Cephaleuros parasiticus]